MNNDGYMNNGIHVVYPRTKYAVVNFDIYNKLTTFLFEFMNAAKQPIQENFYLQSSPSPGRTEDSDGWAEMYEKADRVSDYRHTALSHSL